MRYTIIYSDTTNRGTGIISWIGTSWDSYEDAVKVGRKVCSEMGDDMPNLTFSVFMHDSEWTTFRTL